MPPYAPWLNPIEKLWRLFRQARDSLHRFAQDWPGWQEQVHRFFGRCARRSPGQVQTVA